MSQPEDPNTNNQRDLTDELRELGQQLEQLFRSTVESERAKEIRNDISNGLREIGTQVQGAIHSLAENPQLQELSERGQKAFEQAQANKSVQEFQEVLARGIAQLNSQLANFAQQVNRPSSPPATGETTRLDEEK